MSNLRYIRKAADKLFKNLPFSSVEEKIKLKKNNNNNNDSKVKRKIFNLGKRWGIFEVSLSYGSF